MPNYLNGKIYRLTSKSGLVYYGSTVKKLSDRFDHHKSGHKCYKAGTNPKYCYSYKLFDDGEVEIDLVMPAPCNSKSELEAIERTYIQNDICVNKKIPGLTPEEVIENVKKSNIEYKRRNRDYILQKARDYKVKNADKIYEYKQNRKAELKYFAEILKEELAL